MRPQDLLQIREYALGRSLNHQLGPIYGQSSEIGMTRREEVGLISVYESVDAWSPTLVNTEESTPPFKSRHPRQHRTADNYSCSSQQRCGPGSINPPSNSYQNPSTMRDLTLQPIRHHQDDSIREQTMVCFGLPATMLGQSYGNPLAERLRSRVLLINTGAFSCLAGERFGDL
ncbi:hypothetical protein PM082_006429 [Marasmius tenuissimus]|nr:hypothetical protein PM082_006429 [Marasmius tenuissimus]